MFFGDNDDDWRLLVKMVMILDYWWCRWSLLIMVMIG